MSDTPKPKRGGFQKGQSGNPSGRKKGVPNKLTVALKDMIMCALADAHPNGSVAYLKQQATDNPVAFLTLVGKVLPLQVDAEHKGTIVAQVVFKGLNG